jgi:hypothetical protein
MPLSGTRVAIDMIQMSSPEPVPLVRCRLMGRDETSVRALRYVPLAEFGLWKHLMETRHERQVSIESVSVWVAEDPARWNSGYAAEDLEPVLRVRLEMRGPGGVPVPVERFFPAETYPEAQEALLSHYEQPARVVATPGYFVPTAGPPVEELLSESLAF